MSSRRHIRRLRGQVGSALDHRSLPPEFESRRGHITVFTYLVFYHDNVLLLLWHWRPNSNLDIGRLRGLAVACWTTDHYHMSSNLGVGISEGCFIFDFTSLPSEVARPIYPTMCTKVAVKHQSSSSQPNWYHNHILSDPLLTLYPNTIWHRP